MTPAQIATLEITFTGAETITICAANDIYNYFLYNLSRFELVHGYTPELFVDVWAAFKSRNARNFKRIYDAITAEYNPLHNYDKTQIITETTDNTGAVNTAGFVSTYEKTFETDTPVNSVKTDNSNNTGTTSNTNRTYTDNTRGNIGVTKSTDMINDEILLRANHNITKIICEMFAETEVI